MALETRHKNIITVIMGFTVFRLHLRGWNFNNKGHAECWLVFSINWWDMFSLCFSKAADTEEGGLPLIWAEIIR